MRRPLAAAAVGLPAALLLAACGGSAGAAGGGPAPSASGSPAPAHAQVKVARVKGDGNVLVNAGGYTLYVYAPDARRGVTCTGGCAGTWPPLLSTGTPSAGPGVSASLLGTDKTPGGQTVVTYNKWPLYTYDNDAGPGVASGQGIDLNGGYWYVMAPDGTPIVPKGSPALPGS